MTLEELKEIEARAMNMCGEMNIGLCAQELAEDSLNLIATLKEAWAENERLKNAAIQTPKFFRWGT